MVISKKMTVLIAAILVLAAGLFSTVGGTYAQNVVAPAIKNSPLEIGLEKYFDGNWVPINDGSTGTLFGNTVWEPGAMRAVSLKVTNLAEAAKADSLSFKAWLYPHAKMPDANNMISDPAYLADVMDAYLYVHEPGDEEGVIPMDGNGSRPDLSKFIHLGKLGSLDYQTIPKALKDDATNTDKSVTLAPGEFRCYTLLLKMDESAGNAYKEAVAEVYIVATATTA